MTRHILIFASCFLLGAAVMAAIRAAGHQAYIEPSAMLVDQPVPAAVAADAHAGHTVPMPAGPPVNTICAICGMAVDPKLPTLTYQGKTIGFGCKMCPPKFKAEPDKYGPYYLRNEVIKN